MQELCSRAKPESAGRDDPRVRHAEKTRHDLRAASSALASKQGEKCGLSQAEASALRVETLDRAQQRRPERRASRAAHGRRCAAARSGLGGVGTKHGRHFTRGTC